MQNIHSPAFQWFEVFRRSPVVRRTKMCRARILHSIRHVSISIVYYNYGTNAAGYCIEKKTYPTGTATTIAAMDKNAAHEAIRKKIMLLKIPQGIDGYIVAHTDEHAMSIPLRYRPKGDELTVQH